MAKTVTNSNTAKTESAGIISDSPTISHEAGNSMRQNTSVGSGSRPTPSKVKIESSAPVQPHELSRAPSGWLK